MTTPLMNSNFRSLEGFAEGLREPNRSDASMCLWQLMLKKGRLERAEMSSARVVLPQPVYPTNRTGSLLLMALMERAAIRLKLSFIWT